MSPEDFRKISHPEPKILNSLVNCGHTHGHTHTLTWVNLELTPPEGGSAKKVTEGEFHLNYFFKLCVSQSTDMRRTYHIS